jgi:hypothetical protein
MAEKYPYIRWLVQSKGFDDILLPTKDSAMRIVTRRRADGHDVNVTRCSVPGLGEPIERKGKTTTYRAAR